MKFYVEITTELLSECKAYLVGLGLSHEVRDDFNVFTCIMKYEEAFGNSMKYEITIFGDNVQVDMIVYGKRGAEKSRKSVIWGWLLQSVEDLKLFFKRQIDLNHFSQNPPVMPSSD